MTAGKRRGRKGQSLHLTDKRHPASAILATALGAVSVMLFIGLCWVSGQSHGKAGLLVGLFGIGCFCLSVAGFVLAWISLHQENIRPLFPTIASVLNGLSVVFYLLLYLWGKLM